MVSGCAFDLAHVSYTPAQLGPPAGLSRSFAISKDVQVTQAPCGFSRTLRQNTRWEFVGTIAEGEVYRSRDQVLTVECSNVFEAYLVVSADRLVGFYLPVEKGFVSISDPIQLPIVR
jgi:hypothetical protein